jgi:membrane-associated phospholipid phosphatase
MDRLPDIQQSSPLHARGLSWRSLALFTLAAVLALLIAHLLDGAAHQYIHNPKASSKGLPKMFRGAGYLPMWVLVATALILIDSVHIKTQGWSKALNRGLPLLVAAALSGGVTELLKIIVRRLRPPEGSWDGHYLFKPWSEGVFNGSNIGFPSSHTGVAFGAMAMLTIRYPRAMPIWLIIGAGCATQRLLDRAHFLSDVTMSAITGFVVAYGVSRASQWMRREV